MDVSMISIFILKLIDPFSLVVSTVSYYDDINCSKLIATYTVTKYPGICYDATGQDDDIAESVMLLCSSNSDVSAILPPSTPVLQQVYYGINGCSGQYVFYDIYTANECLIAGNNQLSVKEVHPYSYTWDTLNCTGNPISAVYQPTGCLNGTYTSWYTTASNSNDDDDSGNTLSTDGISGVVIGVIAFLVLVAAAITYFRKPKESGQNTSKGKTESINPIYDTDSTSKA